MIFPIDRNLMKENAVFHHGSILDHDPYDDREACIGALLNKSTHWSSELPKKKDTAEVFTEFHEIWKEAEGDPLITAEKYLHLTNEYLTLLPRSDKRSMLSIKKSSDPSLFDVIDFERSAWQLMHALYSDRICHFDSPIHSQPLRPYCLSEREIVSHLYDTDSELRETQIVVDWLEGKVREEIVKVAGKYECLFNETTIWENTRHLIENMGISDLKAKHIISQLFPDAPFVGEGNLVQKDIENENRYLNYLFLCVRGGDLQRAQRICLQRGDITRAVAMEAWRPFHSSYLSEDIANPDNHVVEGNASRVLSKSVAWWSAENPALNTHERAIFAAQSGNLTALLEAVTSGSWEDLLWAHCRALVESRVDATLRSKLYCGPRADTLAVFGRPQNGRTIENFGLQVPDSAWTPGTWSLSDAFTKAETVMGWRPVDYLFKLMEDESAFDPPPLKPTEIAAFLNRTAYDAVKASGDPRSSSRQMLLQAMFYAIYRGIALREYSEVLTAVASVTPLFIPPLVREILSGGVSNAKWPDQLTLDQLDCHVLRFLAHLVLCLQRLESNLPEEPCNAILEAYIITLIVERRLPLVASYVSRLSTSVRQTRWYASFLSSLNKLEDRHQCLDYAEEAGLDVKRITRAVIRIVRRRFDEQENTGVEDKARAGPFLKPSQTKVIDIVSSDMVPYLTQLDKVRIAALDWLAHDRGQRGELLVLANSLMRLFIAMKKLGAARAVLERLPMALVDQLKVKLLQAEEAYGTEVAKAAVPPWLANSIREHVCLVNYLQAMESFDQWYIHRSSKPNPPVEANNNAASGFTSLAERVAAEEVQKNYQDRLECWNHEVELYTTALVKQLESLLSYESPGWLVDAVVFKINTTDSDVTYDATGMFNTSTMHTIGGNEYEPSAAEGEEHGEADFEGDEGPGIAGLGDSPHARKLQMNILRETCLREIVFTLVKVLKLTNRHAECVRLSDLVADSRYEIFKLFRDYHMQDFMEQLQESMLILQKECGDALGYGEN